MPTVELWYIDLSVNNHNSQVYVDMMNDMRSLKNGVYTATLRVSDSHISDYVMMEAHNHANPRTPVIR